MSTANPNKLKVKDIITVVLLALINVVIFFASSVLYATPITIILMPVFFALLESIVYFIIGTKVKKPGAILIYSIVRAIMGGYLPYIILFILSGAIAELLLWKMGYGNAKALTVSYVINQVLAAFGSTIIPYAIAAKATNILLIEYLSEIELKTKKPPTRQTHYWICLAGGLSCMSG